MYVSYVCIYICMCIGTKFSGISIFLYTCIYIIYTYVLCVHVFIYVSYEYTFVCVYEVNTYSLHGYDTVVVGRNKEQACRRHGKEELIQAGG